ncbi:MAG: response regulator [Candidatus Riflebacteria bacterium]|nr:response regulator [Candidatus Riflebacteria bacterium]
MKILVVDDEPSLREYLAESLRSQNFEVLTAGDGCEGLQLFEAQSPELVFSDIRMPRMDGLDFLSAIRERNRETVVVLVTGLGNEEFALEALRRGANDFLRKPFTQQVLFPLLEKYAGIIATRSRFQETLNLIVRRNFVMSLDNRMDRVPLVVQRLMQETGEAIPADQRLGIRIGLVELVANAIEHGNLEITYEEKMAAMNTSLDGIQSLHAQRLGNPALASRRVTVDFQMDPDSCIWTISDEGSGFDWTTLPSPLDPENLEHPNGRGIFLARLHFDLVEFLGKGNQVRVKKSLPKAAAPAKA